jgi:hypothetical protein
MPLYKDTVNKKINILTLRFKIALTFIATLLFTSCSNSTIAQTLKTDSIKPKENRRFFTFTPITEVEFRNALKNTYNAPFVTEIGDTTKLEKPFESIEKTYSDDEKELAKSELCNSPRCLTSFKAYYPTLDLYLFYVLDYHFSKASFVFASTNEMASGYRRFRGEFGTMSKDGLWVGMERGDCDNYLQIEICKTSKRGVWSLFTFDFTDIDINEEETTAIFWADENVLYIATQEYDQQNNKDLHKYYAIRFEY